ncbi:hypothetical protein NQ317_017594, partial [Molorchus minor]
SSVFSQLSQNIPLQKSTAANIALPKPTFQWSRNLNNIIQQTPFVENSRPNIPDDIETPLDYFFELLQTLVFQTNLYVTQKNIMRAQVPTTLEEIKCFLGVNILMGIKHLCSYKDYWSSREELRDHFIASSMSRNRFSWLLGNIHLNDNSVQPQKGESMYDKLYKLRPMLDKLSETYANSYKPSRCQAIDESMIRFKGIISFRQYMQIKPIKRGYKMWVRANQSGFVSQFQLYTDSRGNKPRKRVVFDLTRQLVGKNHEVYMDNFFNSVALQLNLQKDRIYSCGTARKDRKWFPMDLVEDKVMKRGDYDWKVSDTGIIALKWRDNKPVHFLSNFHDPEDVQLISRKQKDGSRKEYNCIGLVKDYNQHMGYVDKSDMYKSCYEINRKSKKWWHRIFWHFIDLTIVNAFIMFQENSSTHGKTFSLKEFRLAVANGLIGAEPETPQRGRRSLEPIVNKYKPYVAFERRVRRTSKTAHMPIHVNKVRCANCSTKNEPHRTRWHCSSCNVGLGLTDKKNCFNLFHKK